MNMPAYYEFVSRTRIHSGMRALDSLPVILANLGAKRPLMISDKGVDAAGLLKLILKALKGSSIPTFTETPVDSDVATLALVADLYRTKKCDSIIAVGGGSVLDTAKGANILASLGGTDIRAYSGTGVINRELKPMIAIPTTSGTGSEVTNVAVILDREAGVKLTFVSNNLVPRAAVLDPRMTLTLPATLTAMTAMDALTHACEAYIGLAKNPLSDALAIKAISLIGKHLLPVIDNPTDENGRLALANAAIMAGMAFSNSMVGIVHNLAHSLGARCHIPHGMANAVLLPYGLEYNMHRREQEIGELLFPLAGSDVFAATAKRKRGDAVIKEIRRINDALYMKTAGRHAKALKEITDAKGVVLVPREMLPETAQGALKDGASSFNPEEILFDDALMVLSAAWEGTPLNRSRIRKG